MRIDLYKVSKEMNLILNIEHKFKSPFSRKVIEWILHNISYGKTTNYSEIGKHLNSKAYRAIGNVLRSNPIPLIIPCHRIIKKNGQIGGFMGKERDGWQMELKRKLLQIEIY
ncbi:MAG: Methylated-DNA--protein-cysteine methyltransferase, constitutive [Promethearchaeota archaeon]|nr:MAG: Methylated-DNA--protein-cysteine methyltransferase, constitutive [Candidatus Lokiarchaeota archaeon]